MKYDMNPEEDFLPLHARSQEDEVEEGEEDLYSSDLEEGEEEGEDEEDDNASDGDGNGEALESEEPTEPEDVMAAYPDLSAVVVPNVIAYVQWGDIYVDHAISGRLFGRDPQKFKELKDSILTRHTEGHGNGQLEPVGVGKTEEGKLILYSGFGRWQAIKELAEEGKHDGYIKVILWENSVTEGFLGGAESNLKREELNPIQMAGIINTLMSPPFSYKAPEVSKRLAIAGGYVTGLRKLLSFPDDVQLAIADGTIGVSSALDLSRLPTEDGTKLARKFVAKAKDLHELGKASGKKAKVEHKEVAAEVRKLGKKGVRPIREVRDGMISLSAMKPIVEGSWSNIFIALDCYIAGKVDLKDVVKAVQTGEFTPPAEEKRKMNRVTPVKSASPASSAKKEKKEKQEKQEKGKKAPAKKAKGRKPSAAKGTKKAASE